MRHPFFEFGEKVHGYDIPVMNEREVRAAAGIVFALAFTAFMNAFLVANYSLLKVFIIFFCIDFSIRLFINPRFSPSMILGRLAVRKQIPEYAGAPQKRFAWAIGWVLSCIMLSIVVVLGITSPYNLIICMLCLGLMFFEAAFGVCIGCKLYSLITHRKAHLCPGGACTYHPKHAIQNVSAGQMFILTLSIVGLASLIYWNPFY